MTSPRPPMTKATLASRKPPRTSPKATTRPNPRQDSQPYQAQSSQSAPATGINIDELLAAHNAYRTPLGLTPLHWSNDLAAKAQQWAEHLVQIGQMEHSGPGQNLAMASTGTQSLTALV